MSKQLVEPNLNIAVPVGSCLMYVREAFGAPGGVNFAIQGWNNAKYKHTGLPPSDVKVPIWFAYSINGQQEGHVAINVPGAGIYSSPWKINTGHADLTSIAQLIEIYSDNQKNPMSYLGWSEDVNGVRVVEYSATPVSGSPLSKYVGRTVHLASSAGNWRVYRVGSVAPRTAIATLRPDKYNLSYQIEAVDTSPNSVVVTTQEFGRVSLPIASDNNGTLYPTATIS